MSKVVKLEASDVRQLGGTIGTKALNKALKDRGTWIPTASQRFWIRIIDSSWELTAKDPYIFKNGL